jgi:hypothetical protein
MRLTRCQSHCVLARVGRLDAEHLSILHSPKSGMAAALAIHGFHTTVVVTR